MNNFARTDGNLVDKNTANFRLDHNFTTAHHLFGRYSVDETSFLRAAPYGSDNIASPITGVQDFDRQNAVLEDSLTLSPSTVATVRYSITRLGNRREPRLLAISTDDEELKTHVLSDWTTLLKN